MSDLSPNSVFAAVSEALPAEYRGNMVIVGSLAAGYHFFRDDEGRVVRTKDVDSIVKPRHEAPESAREMVTTLLAAGWTHRKDEKWGRAGTSETPDNELPAIRLHPPDSEEYFVEFLTIPDPDAVEGVEYLRVHLENGDYGLPAFRFMILNEFRPELTAHGFFCARPAMMALANLLSHPEITPDTMSDKIGGRDIKRCNKDLGRVLALARLAGDDSTQLWARQWIDALEACFPGQCRELAARSGAGLSAVIESPADLEEAWWTCQLGLLADDGVDEDQLSATSHRLIQDAIEPLEEWGRE